MNGDGPRGKGSAVVSACRTVVFVDLPFLIRALQ